eukprot:m.166970 g.166970  ORF g.166970 m.166970 type:complete len:160 (+) comp14718_c0_seq1:47-526(+)
MADAREKKARLNEIFEHCKREVLGGTFNCAVHEATRLGAYIMQVDLGDYDAAAARILSLDDLVSYLPKNYCDCKTSEKECFARIAQISLCLLHHARGTLNLKALLTANVRSVLSEYQARRLDAAVESHVGLVHSFQVCAGMNSKSTMGLTIRHRIVKTF